MMMVSQILPIIFAAVIVGLAVWLYVRILHKAGYKGWWVILMFVPIVNLIMIWVFAFAKWPALAGVTEDRGSSGRVQGDKFVPGGTIVDRGSIPSPAHPAPAPEREATTAPMGARWMLAGFDGDGHAVRLEFSEADAARTEGLVLGRNSQQCDLLVKDTSVSRRHARITARDGVIEVEDLDSANGTTVNGRMLVPGEPVPAKDGVEIALGEARLRLSGA